MKRRTLLQSLAAAALLPAADWFSTSQEQAAAGQTSTTVYELRVYHTYEGKLDDLLRRFREHTMQIFERSEEHTSELQSRRDLVCRLLLEKKKKKQKQI